jgi:hypothetical protein
MSSFAPFPYKFTIPVSKYNIKNCGVVALAVSAVGK